MRNLIGTWQGMEVRASTGALRSMPHFGPGSLAELRMALDEAVGAAEVERVVQEHPQPIVGDLWVEMAPEEATR